MAETSAPPVVDVYVDPTRIHAPGDQGVDAAVTLGRHLHPRRVPRTPEET